MLVRLGGTVRFAKRKSRDTGDRETFRGESDIGMTFVGLAIALVGSILDYWGGGSGEAFTQVQITGYGLEMTGILSVLLGSMLLGLSYRRTNVLPRLVPWLLITAGPRASCCLLCTSPAEPCSCSAVPG
jgi:hypothetical protein